MQVLQQLYSTYIPQGKGKEQRGVPDTYILYVGRGMAELVGVCKLISSEERGPKGGG